MQAFGGDRFSRVATQVTRSANPDGRSAAAIFFCARKSLARTAVGVTLSITLTSSVVYPSTPQRSSTDRCGAPKSDIFLASARADCLFTRACSGSGSGDERRSIISPTSVEELGAIMKAGNCDQFALIETDQRCIDHVFYRHDDLRGHLPWEAGDVPAVGRGPTG